MLNSIAFLLAKEGWKNTGRLDDQLWPYFNRREELSTGGNCLMCVCVWGGGGHSGNAATFLELITFSGGSRNL